MHGIDEGELEIGPSDTTPVLYSTDVRRSNLFYGLLQVVDDPGFKLDRCDSARRTRAENRDQTILNP